MGRLMVCVLNMKMIICLSFTLVSFKISFTLVPGVFCLLLFAVLLLKLSVITKLFTKLFWTLNVLPRWRYANKTPIAISNYATWVVFSGDLHVNVCCWVLPLHVSMCGCRGYREAAAERRESGGGARGAPGPYCRDSQCQRSRRLR